MSITQKYFLLHASIAGSDSGDESGVVGIGDNRGGLMLAPQAVIGGPSSSFTA